MGYGIFLVWEMGVVLVMFVEFVLVVVQGFVEFKGYLDQVWFEQLVFVVMWVVVG